MERIKTIEALNPIALEATVERRAGRYHATVYRMAEDGWTGWRFTLHQSSKAVAIKRAFEETRARLEAESDFERIAVISSIVSSLINRSITNE